MDPDEAAIKSIPWCSEALSSPHIVIVPTQSRVYKKSTEDAVFAQTLKTENTISACLTFHDKPDSSSSMVHSINTFVTLGYGVNGYPHVVHGGIVALLLDEVMGLLLSINKHQGRVKGLGDAVTAKLEVAYLAPVPTPSTILVKSMVKEIVGRKIYLRAIVQDSSGATLAKGDALWVATSKARGKL